MFRVTQVRCHPRQSFFRGSAVINLWERKEEMNKTQSGVGKERRQGASVG